MRRLGVHKGLGGDTTGTVTPADPRDIPYCVISCSAVKLDKGVWRLAGAGSTKGLAGHLLAGGEQLFWVFFSSSYLLCVFSLNCY